MRRAMLSVLTLLRAPLRRTRRVHWVVAAAVVLPIAVYCWWNNMLEYSLATSFSAFSYPLEVDMEALVDRLQRGEPAGVQPINRLDLPYILNCEKRCRSNDDGNFDSVLVLLVIKSAIGNEARRNMIRRTWGDENAAFPVAIRRVFMLGVAPADRALQRRVGAEAHKHGDIVQRHFVDNYYNNTLKLRTGFEWATAYCEGAQFIAFIDDDFYVSPINMAAWLSQQPLNIVLGYVWYYSMPLRVLDSKWYISLDEYPFRFWPPFASAGAFFVPMKAALRITAAMPYTQYLRFDDVFIGIICWKLHIEMRGSRRIVFDENFTYRTIQFHEVVAAHGFGDPQRLQRAWNEEPEYWHDTL